MRSQKEQNKLNHSSQPGRAPDLDFTITERDPTSTASLASQLSSHCGYYYGRTALSLSLSSLFSLYRRPRWRSPRRCEEEVGAAPSLPCPAPATTTRASPAPPPPSHRSSSRTETSIWWVSIYLSPSLSLCFSTSLSPAQSSVDEDRNEVYSYYTSRVLPTTGPSLACLSSRRNSEYLIIKQRAEATIWDWRQSNWLMISLPAF